MKKLVLMICALAAATSFAGIRSVEGYDDTTAYMQFTYDPESSSSNYTSSSNPGQPWDPAQRITLSIDAECDLWVSNFMDNWYSDIKDLDGNKYEMGNGQYGAFDINTGDSWAGTGETATVTFSQNEDGTGLINDVTAYYVGHIQGGTELALWMTSLEGAKVDSIQYVNDADHPSVLNSRTYGTGGNIIDAANNVRLNYGLISGVGGEFIAFGVANSSPQSGQPLPGVALASILALGSIAAAKKMKKRS